MVQTQSCFTPCHIMFFIDLTEILDHLDSNQEIKLLREYNSKDEIPNYFHLFIIRDKSLETTETPETHNEKNWNENVTFDQLEENKTYSIHLHPFQLEYSIFNFDNEEDLYFFPSKLNNLSFQQAIIDKISFFITFDPFYEGGKYYYWNSDDSFWELPSFEKIEEIIINEIGKEEYIKLQKEAELENQQESLNEIINESDIEHYDESSDKINKLENIDSNENIEDIENDLNEKLNTDQVVTETENIETEYNDTEFDQTHNSNEETETETDYPSEMILHRSASVPTLTIDDGTETQLTDSEEDEPRTEYEDLYSKRNNNIIRSKSNAELYRENIQKSVTKVDYLKIYPTPQFSCLTTYFDKYDKVNYQDGRGGLENIMESDVFPFTIGCGENRILVSIKCTIVDHSETKKDHHVLSIARDWTGQYIAVISLILNDKQLSQRLKGGSSKADLGESLTSVLYVFPIVQSIHASELGGDEYEILFDYIPIKLIANSKQWERLLYNVRIVLQILNSRENSDIQAIHNSIAAVDFCKEIKPILPNNSEIEKQLNIFTNMKSLSNINHKPFNVLRELIREISNRDHLILKLSSLIISNIINPRIGILILEQIIICPQPIRKVSEDWAAIIKFLQNLKNDDKAGGLVLLSRLAKLFEASLTYCSKSETMIPIPFPQEFLTGVSILSRRERDVINHSKKIRSKLVEEGVFLCLLIFNKDHKSVLSSLKTCIPRYKLPMYSYYDALNDRLQDPYSDIYNKLLSYRSYWSNVVHSLQNSGTQAIEKSLGKLVDRIEKNVPSFGMLYDRVAYFPDKKMFIIFSISVTEDIDSLITKISGSVVEDTFEMMPVKSVEHEFLEIFNDIHPMRPLENISTGFFGDRWISNALEFLETSRPLQNGVYISIYRFRMTEYGFQIQVMDSNRNSVPYIRIGDSKLIQSSNFRLWLQSYRAREYTGKYRVSKKDIQIIKKYPYNKNIESLASFRSRFLIAIEKLKHDYNLDDIGVLFDQFNIEYSDHLIHIPIVSFCFSKSNESNEGIFKDVNVFDWSHLSIYHPTIFHAVIQSIISRSLEGDYINFLERDYLKYLLSSTNSLQLFNWLQNGGQSIAGKLYSIPQKWERILQKIEDENERNNSLNSTKLLILNSINSIDHSLAWDIMNESMALQEKKILVKVDSQSLQSKGTEESEIKSKWVRFPNEDEDNISPHFISPFSMQEISNYRKSQENYINETDHSISFEICWNITHEIIDNSFLKIFESAVVEASEVLSDLVKHVEEIEKERQENLIKYKIDQIYNIVYNKRNNIKEDIVSLFSFDNELDALDIVNNMTYQFSKWMNNAEALFQTIISTQIAYEVFDESSLIDEVNFIHEDLIFESTINAKAHMPPPIPFVRISLREEIKDQKDLFIERKEVQNIENENLGLSTYKERLDLIQSDETELLYPIQQQNQSGATVYILSNDNQCFVSYIHKSLSFRCPYILSLIEKVNPIQTSYHSETVQIVSSYLSSSTSEVSALLSSFYWNNLKKAIIEQTFNLSKTLSIPTLFIFFGWILRNSQASFRLILAVSFIQECTLEHFYQIESELVAFPELIDNLWFLRCCTDFPEISDSLTYKQHKKHWRNHYAQYRIEVFLKYRIHSLPQSKFRNEIINWKEKFGPLVHSLDLRGCTTVGEDEIEIVFATCFNLKFLNVEGTSIIDLKDLASTYHLDKLHIVM